MNFCDRDIINLFCYYEKIHTSIWIAGKDLIKHYYLIKKIFTNI